MANEGSRRAWEILSSYREETNEDTEVDDIDTFLRTPPGEYQELVDGWSSLLSSNPSALALEIANIDLDCDESSGKLKGAESRVQIDPDSHNLGIDDLGNYLDGVSPCLQPTPDNQHGGIITASATEVSQNGASFDDLTDVFQLIQSVNKQLDEDRLQHNTSHTLSNELATNEQSNYSPVGHMASDCNVSSVFQPNGSHRNVSSEVEENTGDLGLDATEALMASSSYQLFDPITTELSNLSSNLAQCLVEKSLLEADIKLEEQKFQDFVFQEVVCGDDGEERYLMYPEFNNHYQQLPLLSEGDEDSTPSALELQIIDFIDSTSIIFRSRIDMWTNDLQNDLECESINSTEEDPTLSLSHLPDEILLRILSYIPIMSNLTVLSLVCKRWYILAADPSLWQHLYIATDTPLDPHWLCYMVKRSPQLRTLSIRGDHNIRRESLSVLTLYCPQLTTVNFGFCNISQSMLTNLVTRCPNIASANFEGCESVTSDWIRTLCQLQRLVSINISHCQFLVDEDIVYIAEHLSAVVNINIDGNSFLSDISVVPLCRKHCNTLVTLSIDGAESTDKSMEAVSTCDNLNMFTVSFADNLTPISIDHLLKLQWLCHLRIRKGPYLDTPAFHRLFQFNDSMQYLLHLDLTECTTVVDSVVSVLCYRCPRLVRLILGWCWNITDAGVDNIVRSCHNLEYLDLLGLELIDGYSFDLLPQMLPKLTFLNLVQCNKVDDKLIKQVLHRMPQLTAINYYHEDFRTAI